MTRRLIRRTVGAVVGILVLTLPLHSMPIATAASSRVGPADWLVWDAATHTVTLTLIAGYNLARRGFNFNGYSTGTMVISVPRGARVRVIFRNQGRFPHSAIIARYAARTHDSSSGFPLAFPGAHTPDPLHGITQGKIQQFTFVAGRVGRYALVCGVGHHAQAGMWDVFQVTPGGAPHLAIPQGR